MGTIDLLGIKSEDIFFIRTRDYDCKFFPEGSKVVDCSRLNDKCYSAYGSRKFFFVRKTINEIDQFIKSEIGCNFFLFVPHLGTPFITLLYTNRQCRKVSFVAEGVYTAREDFITHLSLKSQIKIKMKNLLMHYSFRFYNTGYWYMDGVLKNNSKIDVYGLKKEMYKYIPCIFYEVKWPALNIELPEKIIGPVFVFDGYIGNNMAEENYYMDKCQELVNRYGENNSHIKFHPNQKEKERAIILGFFERKDLNYSILDDNFPFEYYITGNNYKMKVIGFSSTLLYFARLYGHYVISCDTWMLGSPLFRKFADTGYPFFHNFFNEEINS